MRYPTLCNISRFNRMRQLFCRRYSSNCSHLSSREIRQRFLDYFANENGHKLVRSSPVVPFSDPTIAFVNAGMNQFKNVFLGTAEPPCKRATNSQKCIRVGGKHNDISVVGNDGYHHTFFEMLGNWSFGDYFKREACEMALRLLKDGYNIDGRRLYVTYFGGDEIMGLPADLETKEIWASLGISAERIIPFGAGENFWEMGSSGPCGPCTEIYIDHSDQFMDVATRRQLVNAGVQDLTEVWNIVFIQYNRSLDDGCIRNLPQRHVDTGMGLERLVAHLQQKSSNYDTDLFTPLFDRICKVTNKEEYGGTFDVNNRRFVLDTAYRIVADHTRMITACLSDGMFPLQSPKLRRVIRRSLSMSDRIFSCPTLVRELVPAVVESLGPTYPEMEIKLNETQLIIEHEEQSFQRLCANVSSESRALLKQNSYLEEVDVLDHPGLPHALKEIKRLKLQEHIEELSGKVIFKMYDTYGLDEDILLKIAANERLDVDLVGYNNYTKQLKEGAKLELAARLHKTLETSRDLEQNLNQAQIHPTRNEYKYNYVYNKNKQLYEIPQLKTKITSLVEGEIDLYHVITEKSNFYCESGGQQGDTGSLWLANDPSIQFEVKSVSEFQGFVMHSIAGRGLVAKKLSIGDEIVLSVDPVRRSSSVLHHTATHLLNATARSVLQVPICQRSSYVGDKGLKLELAVCCAKLEPEKVEIIEQNIRKIIQRNEPIKTRVCNAVDVDFDKVIMIPGEVYPEKGLRIVDIGSSISSEFCCGTHAQSTGELQDFSITNVSQSKSGCYTFHAIAGSAADRAHTLGEQIRNDVAQLKQDMADREMVNDAANIDTRLQRLKNVLIVGSENDINLPYAIRQKCLTVINELYDQFKDTTRASLREFIDMEMKSLLQQKPPENNPFIVHFLESSMILEEVQLSKVTRYIPERPFLVISLTDNQVKARATVPAAYVNERFDAQKWIKLVGQVFKSGVSAPRGQNPTQVCNMKSRKVKPVMFEALLERALQDTAKFAKQNMM
ncbi:alanine--tRNA ligase, mitochondrial [Toxorhynchites rutilus septentrionalis]|uniref:alanine--tRNA ligase, mitochondrial n=1 Tax=Toxorhynchites rutilus septentrionalis TaxID=329112 RepID=UPI0024794A84|nr:alanine--tRNA ligase, mitochondrial [Toxorhynchites rutilus septentrionalis]